MSPETSSETLEMDLKEVMDHFKSVIALEAVKRCPNDYINGGRSYIWNHSQLSRRYLLEYCEIHLCTQQVEHLLAIAEQLTEKAEKDLCNHLSSHSRCVRTSLKILLAFYSSVYKETGSYALYLMEHDEYRVRNKRGQFRLIIEVLEEARDSLAAWSNPRPE